MQAIADRPVMPIERLEPEGDLEFKIERLVEGELHRRLARYQLVDRQLSRRYGLSFQDFKVNRVVEHKGYSFEVESDFWDWEMALDGIATVQDMLGHPADAPDTHDFSVEGAMPTTVEDFLLEAGQILVAQGLI
jgi:hypothetical protein